MGYCCQLIRSDFFVTFRHKAGKTFGFFINFSVMSSIFMEFRDVHRFAWPPFLYVFPCFIMQVRSRLQCWYLFRLNNFSNFSGLISTSRRPIQRVHWGFHVDAVRRNGEMEIYRCPHFLTSLEQRYAPLRPLRAVACIRVGAGIDSV